MRTCPSAPRRPGLNGIAALALSAGLLAAGPLAAADPDEFQSVLKETQDLYAAGDTGAVKKNLEYLLQLVAEMRLTSIVDFLPAPMEGWTAEEGNQTAMSAAMFGGGLSASRTYRKGEETVELTIVGDSPMLAQMSMIFSNPMIASSSGHKMIRIDREPAMVQDDQVMMLVGNRWMLTAQGTAGEEAKVGYLTAIDRAGLKAYE